MVLINLGLIICSLTSWAFKSIFKYEANVNFNVLGNVAENPIDEIFYENRGRSRTVNTDEEFNTY
jgi:hypothetical protein